MVKPDIETNDLKSPIIYIKFLLYYILTTAIIGTIVFYCIITIYNRNYVRYENILKSTNLDTNTICTMLDCTEVVYKLNDTYQRYRMDTNGSLTMYRQGPIREYKNPPILLGNITSDFNILIRSNKGDIIIDNRLYKTTMRNIFILCGVVFIIPYTLVFIYMYIRLAKRRLIDKGKYKSELETRLQRDLTEMLHHELGAPLAVISSGIEELYALYYPCDKTETGHCDFYHSDSIPDKCKDCASILSELDKHSIAIGLFRDIEFGIDRIKSILNVISNSKHIRFSNGTVPIYTICENIISSINSFKLHKLTAKYEGIDILKNYSAHHNLGNGNLLNLLHVLCNNSIEAYANEITFKAVLLNDNFMSLYVTDNGSGILDSSGKPKLNKDIFKYGYSSKDMSAPKYKEGLLSKILNTFGFKLVTSKTPTRGIGLYISRETIIKAGGNLELFNTSEQGTTFKITLPIKKTEITEHNKIYGYGG